MRVSPSSEICIFASFFLLNFKNCGVGLKNISENLDFI